jgi:hypothetical protein
MEFIEKRACERIPVNVSARFFVGNVVYTGMVTDLSEKGMCVKTQMCLPCNSKFELLIPFKEEILKVPVIVKRVVKTSDLYDTMGVELQNPSKKYLELVKNLKIHRI